MRRETRSQNTTVNELQHSNTSAQRTPPKQRPPKPTHKTEHNTNCKATSEDELRQGDSSAQPRPQQHNNTCNDSINKRASPDRSDAKTAYSQSQVQHSADPCLKTPRQGRPKDAHEDADKSQRIGTTRKDTFQLDSHPSLRSEKTHNDCELDHLMSSAGSIAAVRKDTQRLEANDLPCKQRELERPEKTHSNSALPQRTAFRRPLALTAKTEAP